MGEGAKLENPRYSLRIFVANFTGPSVTPCAPGPTSGSGIFSTSKNRPSGTFSPGAILSGTGTPSRTASFTEKRSLRSTVLSMACATTASSGIVVQYV